MMNERDMKTTLELRPVYHRLEDRIRAHVILCWLALLLVRIVETTTGDTWNRIREDCKNCTSAPSKAPPAPSGNAPSSPSPNTTSSPSSVSTHPRRSSNSDRHPRRPDQHEHHRLDTRLSRLHSASPQVKPQIPCPAPTSAAEPGSESELLRRTLRPDRQN